MMWKQMRRNSIQIEGEHSASVDLCTSRLSVLALFFMLAFMMIGLRLIDLSVVQGVGGALLETQPRDVPQDFAQTQDRPVRRGNIYDRHGVLLATDVLRASVFADPSLILEPRAVAEGLVKIFPDLNKDRIAERLKGNGRFLWIKRGITPAQQKAVLKLGQPGLGFVEEEQRIYPQGASAAHLIGYTDLDGNGLAGVERNFDEVLRKGEDVRVSLDSRLQHIVKRETEKAMAEFTAKAGAALIMDVQTGEILAGVSLPDYDLNRASILARDQAANEERLFNRLTLGVYELGSMFKIFSTAAFFETQENGLEQAFDVRKPIRIGRFTINDFKGKDRILSVPEVFIYSSNIGTANMGRMVGGEYLRGFYKDLGLLDPMRFDIREVGRPQSPPVPWKEVSIMTASYGHGLSTTPLQMAAAVASVINGGILVRPLLTPVPDEGARASAVRVVSPETSDKMRRLLRMVVTEGTGSKADVPGFFVGGKTGTAEKIVAGRYDRTKLISSFVSAFPMDNPRFVVMVMVDEPKPNAHSHGYATAGWVAAPAVARIVTAAASVLGLPGDTHDPESDIGRDYMAYVKENYEGVKMQTVKAPHKKQQKELPEILLQEEVQHVSY